MAKSSVSGETTTHLPPGLCPTLDTLNFALPPRKKIFLAVPLMTLFQNASGTLTQRPLLLLPYNWLMQPLIEK